MGFLMCLRTCPILPICPSLPIPVSASSTKAACLAIATAFDAQHLRSRRAPLSQRSLAHGRDGSGSAKLEDKYNNTN